MEKAAPLVRIRETDCTNSCREGTENERDGVAQGIVELIVLQGCHRFTPSELPTGQKEGDLYHCEKRRNINKSS